LRVSQKFYSPSGTYESVEIDEDQAGEHFGLILKKPEGYTGGPVAVETLDSGFVKSCVSAKDEMKTFVDTNLNFPLGYPFVESKK